jgi:sulfur carrier protein ThiS
MSVTIRPTGLLKTYASEQSSLTLDCDGMTVRECLVIVKIPSELVAAVMVNGILKNKDYLIQDRDVIQLIPLVGGG